MTPKLSVIIPCYNCAETLEEAFDSLCDQRLSVPFEVVMVDDCSTDGTRALMEKLAMRRDTAKAFFHEKNLGGGAARNTAVRNSSAEIIFCLDSDDMLPPGSLARMYDFIIGKGCDGVGIEKSIKFSGKDRTKVDAVHRFEADGREIAFEDLLQKNGRLCPLYSTFMITKKAFALTGGYPEDHGFDTQSMAWRFLANGLSSYVCPGAEYLHRVNFHRSYYIREYESGKVSHNWFRIFDEFLYLFSDSAKEIILGTDLNDYKKNLYDLIQKLDSPFIGGRKKYLVPNGKDAKRKEIEEMQRKKRTAYDSYWLGGELLKAGQPEDASRCFEDARASGFRFPILDEKIAISELCRSGKTLKEASEEIESRKKFRKLGSQSPIWRRVFIFFKKRLRPFKVFYLELKDRKESGGFPLKASALGLLYMRKALGAGFRSRDSSEEAIDVVIPTISKDLEVLEASLMSLRNLKQKVNRIFIVSRNEERMIDFCRKGGYSFVDEASVLGYGKDSIAYSPGGTDRSGWIYQQMLKLGAEAFVEREHYLVLDSDTVLVSENSFIQGGKSVFQQGAEWHEPYRKTFEKLFCRKPETRLSSVCHMMIFNVQRLREMKAEIEKIHSEKWDQAILGTLDPDEASSFSEYETYANWMRINRPSEIRCIPFYNRTLSRSSLAPLADLEAKYGGKLKSVSFHSYAGK